MPEFEKEGGYMKRIFFLFFGSLIVMNASLKSGDGPQPANMSSSVKPQSSIEGIKHLEPTRSESRQEAPQNTPYNYIPIQPINLAQKSTAYLHPGILVNFNGVWEGSDHLYNLTKHIGVNVTLVKADDMKIEVTSEILRKNVEAIFQKGFIDPHIVVGPNDAPLPVFEVEIFLYALDKGFVASCQGRLFESVVPGRVKLDNNMAFQAITWEKQSLILGPKEEFAALLTKEVSEMATSFVEKFTIFERLKSNAQ